MLLQSKSIIIAAAHPANLIGLSSKEAGTCQIQVADGCDGDSVVGVVVLYGLRGADYRVLEIIFILLCNVGRQTKAISKQKCVIVAAAFKCLSHRELPVFPSASSRIPYAAESKVERDIRISSSVKVTLSPALTSHVPPL